MFKNLFSSNKEEVMVEEAQKGEKSAIEEYNDILAETNLPARTETLLKQQRDQIQSGQGKIKSLEDIA